MRSLLLALTFATTMPAEEWTRFRGPNGSGIAVGEDRYPTEFSPSKNLAWRTAVRPGKSSPVLSNTSIFLTGFQDEKIYTQCFDRVTGKLLWERSEPRTRADNVNRKNHPAALTPVTDGENVFVLFPEFGLLSYTAAGKLRWQAPIDPSLNSQGLGASPILAGDSVVIQVDQIQGSYIAAYAKSNGELRWKVAREESEGWATPLLHQPPAQPLLIITAGNRKIGGHLVSNGKRTFTFPGAAPAMVASPIMDGHTVLAFGYGSSTSSPFTRELARRDKNKDGRINRDEYTQADNVLNSIGNYIGNRDGEITEDEWIEWGKHVGGGTALVALQLDAAPPTQLWRTEKGFESVIPSPILHDGLIYVVRNGGILTAYDAKTGQPAEASRITGALGGYSASPVLANGLLYFASEDGKISVVRPGREWQVLHVNDIGDHFFATPALSGGRIYARGNDALYCFSVQ
jgi:outer membrane protein assembly factor BamB